MNIKSMFKKSKYIILSFILLSFVSSVFGQKKNNDQLDINTKIEYANNLIWHYNYNIRSLRNFQNDLNIWFENPQRNIKDIPRFNFMTYSGDKVNINQTDRLNNDLFNYNFHLDRLEKQILQFNLNSKKIENLVFSSKTSAEEEKYLNDLFQIINEINRQSLDLAEISYDFSRACAVSYKNEVYPKEIAKVKNVVAQSKNLILALRENNPKLTQEYLDLLNSSLLLMKNTTNIRELFLIPKSKLSLEELDGLLKEIYQKSSTISQVAELYIKTNPSQKETIILLQKAINEFNEAEGKTGCASGFNTILKYSDSDLMYFTEEPNTIVAEKIIPEPKKTNSSNEKIVSEVLDKTPTIKEPQITKKIELPIPIEKEEVFDINNKNTLAGSLPNNLIILLDVSVSMKKSNKLPILKESISHFLNIMRPEDKISLIAYSGKSQVLVSGASKTEKKYIIDTLNKVSSSGGSDLYSALQEAYRIGEENFIKNGNNKIIIASDGIFGVDLNITKLVSEKTKKEFSLSVFHYSTTDEEVNIKLLKNLAETGKGSYRVIYNNQEAIDAMMIEIKKQDFKK